MNAVTTQQLDPRWEWIEVTAWADPGPRYVKGHCRHLDVEPVESVVDGERLATLCLTCDQQLPAELLVVGPGEPPDSGLAYGSRTGR